MATTLTIEQFAIKVLMKLGVYEPGNSLNAVDLQNVSDAYDAVYQTLLDEGLVNWTSASDIPVRFSLPLIDLVMSQIKQFYNGTITQVDLMPIADQPGTLAIRRQLATPYVQEETDIEAF